ncbi:MAG: peptidase M35, partial [Telluria sp.]
AGVACIGAQAASNKGVTATVAAEKSVLGKNDNVTVRLTLTNTSAQPQMVLKWHTAFAEIEESLFEVTRDGAKVPYLGAHFKRGAPKASDYYLLKPGASHTVRVELSDKYDMSITGQYTIAYKAASVNLFGTNEKSVGEITSQAASVWIDGAQPRGTESVAHKAPSDPTPSAGALTFSKCTTSQQATVTQALGAAST